ncbi:phage protease [Neorhizobium petrolearium]|uniref:phage protease n=1 Tax=Neorhizobium petrolearium TaxID=515361 RepID=UPI003F818265
MKNALALLAASLLSAHVADISAAGADGAWIRLIPAGTFSGRDGRGPYHAGDLPSLQQIAALTQRYHGPTEILVDYEHQSLNAEKNGKPAPAAGWIKEVQARADGLYGRVEWTANASAAIEAKEYRYLSPVYFHTKDGKILALQNAALTNSPNLNLPEVTAHSIFSATANTEVSMKKVLAALGLSEGTGEYDVLAAINSLLTSSTAIAVAAGLTKDAKSEAVLAAVQSTVADRKKIAIAAGQKEDATTDQIVSAFAAKQTATSPDPTQFVPIAQVEAMQADIKALQKQLQDDKAEEAVAEAIRDGKLAPALKEWGLSMHRADPKKFEEFVGKAPVLTSAQRAATAKAPGEGANALDDADLAVMRQMGLTEEQMLKSKKGGDA